MFSDWRNAANVPILLVHTSHQSFSLLLMAFICFNIKVATRCVEKLRFFLFFLHSLMPGYVWFRIYISQCHLCTEICVYLYVVSDGFKLKYMYGMDGFSVALPSPRYLQMKITILFVYIFTNYTSYDDKLNSTSKMQFFDRNIYRGYALSGG